MNLEKFCQELTTLYDQMGDVFSQAQARTQMSCPTDCGQCCQVPTVEATMLEMMPMAWELYKRGEAESTLDRLSSNDTSRCLMFESHSQDSKKGRCTMYQQRPTVCRAFGVAGYYKKDRSIDFSVCRHLKDLHPTAMANLATASEEERKEFPVLSEWNMLLLQIHPDLVREYGPISVMLCKALEKVLFIEALKGSNTLE